MNDHLIVHDCGIPIGSLASKLKSHQDNDNIHLTPEEKEKLRLLNIKDYSSINAQDINSIKTELKNKADVDDIPERVSQLENDLNFISEIPDYYTTEEEVKLLLEGYIGDYINQEINIEDIDKKIEELTELINKYKIDLDELKKIIESLDIPEDLNSLISEIQQQIEDIYSKISDLDSRVSALEDWKDDNPDGPDTPGQEYELPVATSTILGGIKVGEGLDITPDGVLSTVGSNLPIDPDEPIDVDDILNETDRRYLSKLKDDTTPHHLTIQDGITIGDDDQVSIQSSNFAQGETLGKGFFLGQWGDSSYLEVDRMSVRKQAFFNELEIRKLSYVNGTVVLSPTGSVIESVEEVANGWKCILKPDDGSMSTTNSWAVNDMARCEEFGDIENTGNTMHNVRTKYYWRAVTEVGHEGEEDTSEMRNYVILSNEIGAYDGGSGVPQAGDTIVCFGHMADTLGDDEGFDRRNLIELSSTSMDSPSLKMYSNIHAFNDDYTEQAVISPSKILFNSKLFRLITDDGETPICIDRGAWDDSLQYYYWDRVSHKGRLWLCVNKDGSYGTTPPKGMEPGSNAQGGYSSEDYWLLQIDKGQDGDTSGVYQMQLTDLVLFTQKTDDGYSPSIVGREIGVAIYQGAEQLSGSQYELSIVPEAGITVGSQKNNGFTITGCTLNGGETADIVIKATINDTSVVLQQSIQVICTQNPVEEDSYNVIVETENLLQDAEMPKGSDGYVESLSIKDILAKIRVYEGTNLLDRADVPMVGNLEQVSSLDNTKFAMCASAYIYKQSADSDVGQYEPAGMPDETEVASYTTVFVIDRGQLGESGKNLPSIITNDKTISIPNSKGYFSIYGWNPGNRDKNAPNFHNEYHFEINISGSLRIWEVTDESFKSIISDTNNLFTMYSGIDEEVGKIAMYTGVDTIEGEVTEGGLWSEINETIDGKLSGLTVETGVKVNELLAAGLAVHYELSEDGEPVENSGDTYILSDKFTLCDPDYYQTRENPEPDGTRYIWYEDDTLNLDNMRIGPFIVTKEQFSTSLGIESIGTTISSNDITVRHPVSGRVDIGFSGDGDGASGSMPYQGIRVLYYGNIPTAPAIYANYSRTLADSDYDVGIGTNGTVLSNRVFGVSAYYLNLNQTEALSIIPANTLLINNTSGSSKTLVMPLRGSMDSSMDNDSYKYYSAHYCFQFTIIITSNADVVIKAPSDGTKLVYEGSERDSIALNDPNKVYQCYYVAYPASGGSGTTKIYICKL